VAHVRAALWWAPTCQLKNSCRKGKVSLVPPLIIQTSKSTPFFCMFRIRNCHFRLGKNCYALIVWIVIFLNCLKIDLFEYSFETLYFDQS
jgi:hypothetical protein